MLRKRRKTSSGLLLNVTLDYKVAKVATSVDWESVKSKYEDILERFKAELPVEPPSEAKRERIDSGLAKDYPHTKEVLTKQILTTKLKAIRQMFRQAVDSGRHSGHGRVVLIYYELYHALLCMLLHHQLTYQCNTITTEHHPILTMFSCLLLTQELEHHLQCSSWDDAQEDW